MVKIYCENIHRPGSFELIDHKDLKHVENVYALIEYNNHLLTIELTNTNLHFFPGGKVEQGETHQLALKREVYEETNQVVNLSSVQEFYNHKAYIYHPVKKKGFSCSSFYYKATIHQPFSPLGLSHEGQACWTHIDNLTPDIFSPNGFSVFKKYIMQV